MGKITIRAFTVTVASAIVLVAGATAGAQTPAPTPRAGLTGSAAKAAVKCAQSISKAATVFAAKRQASLKNCVDAVFVCVQTKASDAKCLPKAQTTCNKAFARIAAAEAKLVAGVTAKCGPGDVATADLLDESGLGFGLAGGRCAEVGVTVADIADVAECITKQHTCRVEENLAVYAPLAEYLLGLVGRPLYSAFCPSAPQPTPSVEATAITPTPTGTPEATPTETPAPTATETPEPTPTPGDPEPTATETPEPTPTPGDPEPTATETPEPTATATPDPEATATATPDPEATATETPEPTPTPEEPEATATETPVPTPTATPGCGNGVLEDGEQCDGEDFGDADCTDFCEDPAPEGALACNPDCTLDFAGCEDPTCDTP